MATRGRKAILEVTPKQIEVYELILNHVKMYGFQPNLNELSRLLNIKLPATRERVHQLVNKGLFTTAPFKSERSLGFVGVKFAAYEVDQDGNPVSQTIDLGTHTLTIKPKV